MNKKWSISLPIEQRGKLEGIIRKRKSPARIIRRAQILLFADEGKGDIEIALLLKCAVSSVYVVRQGYCKGGLDSALL